MGRRQIVVTATDLSEHPAYRWLNDSVAVGCGEVRAQESGPPELVVDWTELIREPPSDEPAAPDQRTR